MSDQQISPDLELTAIEAALGALTPSRGPLDRDRVMFQAGRASARLAIGRRAWPALAASLAMVALGEAALLADRPESRIVERVVVVHEPAPEPPSAPAPSDEELASIVILSQRAPGPRLTGSLPTWPGTTDAAQLHQRVRRFGLDALPELPPLVLRSGGDSDDFRPESSGALLRSEIARLLNPGEPS